MEKSCGILAYRFRRGWLQVLLGRDGGPFNRELPWNIPKGHVEEGEDDKQCAKREFTEETGLPVPDDAVLVDLGVSKTSKGKEVRIFGMLHDYNPDGDAVEIRSMPFQMEYPRDSGRMVEFPELESAKYLHVDEAMACMFPYQKVFVERLLKSIEEE